MVTVTIEIPAEQAEWFGIAMRHFTLKEICEDAVWEYYETWLWSNDTFPLYREQS